MFYNTDCISGARQYLTDNSVDLIITDPPYGIGGDKLHKHYNRKEEFVLDGYVEVDPADYAQFSMDWIREAERVLKPGGSIYIVSGYSNLIHILNALAATTLVEINHIIWKYNFGVYTKNKYISSHYHILFYQKPGGNPTFNTFSRFSDAEKSEPENGSLNYQDREDVWTINREFKPGKVKNKNELPQQLLIKMLQYSSNPDDLVCDFFLGSFSTAKAAIGLGRRACGFEISQTAFDHQMVEMKQIIPGFLLDALRNPSANIRFNQGKPISADEKREILLKFLELVGSGHTKRKAIEILSREKGRGMWSITRIIDGESKGNTPTVTTDLPSQ